MIRPWGRSRIDGSAAWIQWTTPKKLTSIMRRNNAASDLAKLADSAAPALAIRISIGWRAAASRIAGSTAAGSVTSATTEKRATPCATSSSRAAFWRPSTVTTAPALVNCAAISRPMPRAAPVTTACGECGSLVTRNLPERFQRPFGFGYILYFKLWQTNPPVRGLREDLIQLAGRAPTAIGTTICAGGATGAGSAG